MQDLIWGWSGTTPVRVLVDSSGHLQVDALSSALPTGAATSAKQDTMITALQIIDDMEVKLQGYDGTAWQKLLTEDDTNFNLRTRLYAGANALYADAGTVVGCAPVANQVLAVKALLQSYSSSGSYTPVVRGSLMTDTYAAHGTIGVYLMGFNGTNWDRLRVGTPADAFTTPGYALQVHSFLMGYNGASWDMLGVQDSTYRNLRVAIYQDDSQVKVMQPNADGRATTDVLLRVGSYLHGFNGTTWDRVRVSAAKSLMTLEETTNPTTSGKLTASALLNTGLTHLYGITISTTVSSAIEVNLYDNTSASGNPIWGVRVKRDDACRCGFRPWIECNTGLYCEIIGTPHAVVIEYGG